MKFHLLLQKTILALLALSVVTACNVEQLTNLKPEKKSSALSKLSELVQKEYGKNINVPPLPDNIKQDFAYTPNAKIISLNVKEEKADWTVFEGMLSARDQAHVRNDPTTLGNPQGDYFIKFIFYYAKRILPGGNPLIVQIPALGSNGGPEAFVSEYFARLGLHTLLVLPDHGASSADQPIELVHQYFIRNTVAVQQALDFVLALNKLDPNAVQEPGLDPLVLTILQATFRSIDSGKILGHGISMGGIRMGYLLAVEPRIVKGVIMMGGGDLPHIIANSHEPTAVEYQDKQIAKLIFEGKLPPTCTIAENPEKRRACNVALLENYLRGIFKYDNLYLAQFVKSKRVSMLISNNDNVVPTADQIKLWDALGQPSVKMVTYSYYDAEKTVAQIPFLSAGDKKKLADALNHIYNKNPTGHFDLIIVVKEALQFAERAFTLGIWLKSFF